MVGRCRLCRLDKRLLLSHIAPRWAFTWMKQEGGVYGSYQSHGIEYVEQDGSKHYLLCAACEQLLGRAENYLAQLCRGRPADLAAMGVELTTPPGLNHLDINRVLIALVGIALKGHLAPSPPFAAFHLPKRLFNRLRGQVLAEEMNPRDVGLVRAWKWLGGYIPGANPKAFLYPALRAGSRGGHLLDIEMGGWSFSLVLGAVDCEAAAMPASIRPWPHDAGWVETPVVDMTENFRINYGNDWFPGPRTGDRWAGVEPAAPCPCGLFDQKFESCCRHTWCHFGG